ncbi:glycosyltransferase family 4 protein [Seongchinamella sediminis]|uniref:glycosyltransferase family 4 protein n=1 Tax=Seongchinamella sediminis TaxID=2283635 RepID=UPI001EF11E37|nr:glycosyltransferase family 4 protein [Seongchinamella sediminis]
MICYLATSAGDWGGASRYLFDTLKLLDRTKYEPIILFPASGPIFPQLDQMKIPYRVWGTHEPNGVLSIAKYGAGVFSTMKFFIQHRVDIVHINHTGYWRPAEILAAKLLRIPIITHLHVCCLNPPPFIKYCSLALANSHYTATHSETMGVPIKVAYCPVDPQRYERASNIRPSLQIEDSDIVIAFLGQIREIKGIDLFIELTQRISEPHIKFLIAGACRDKSKFRGSYSAEDLEEKIGADPRVRYLGHRNDVENIYHAADIIVMPSRWEEPFGLINIEAGASRRPIISTRSGGIPEIVRDGENGFLIEKDDIDMLLDRTITLINNPGLRRSMGNRGREIIEADFVEKPVRVIEEYYDELAL